MMVEPNSPVGIQPNQMPPASGSTAPKMKKMLLMIVLLLVILGVVLALFNKQFNKPKDVGSGFKEVPSVRGKAIVGFPKELVPPTSATATIDNSYSRDMETYDQYVLNMNNKDNAEVNFTYFKKFLIDNGYEVTGGSVLPVAKGDAIQLASVVATKGNTKATVAIVYDIAKGSSAINITYNKSKTASTSMFNGGKSNFNISLVSKALAATLNCVQGTYSTWEFGNMSLYIDGVDVTPGVRSGSYSYCPSDITEGGSGGGGVPTDTSVPCSLGVLGRFNSGSVALPGQPSTNQYSSTLYANNAHYRVWSTTNGTVADDYLTTPTKGYSGFNYSNGAQYFITILGNFRDQTVNGYLSDFFDFDGGAAVYSAKSASISCFPGGLEFIELPYRSKAVIDTR